LAIDEFEKTMFTHLSAHLVLGFTFLGLLAQAVFADLEELRIPNQVCIALVALYPAYVLASGGSVDWAGALLVALAVFAAGIVPFAVGWIGGGDVKLMAATALWIGPASAIDFLLVMALVGGAMAVVMLSEYRFALARLAEVTGCEDIRDAVLGRAIPYGVAIAAAGWIVGGPVLLAPGR
jgi:prepilin peptidase CpaA